MTDTSPSPIIPVIPADPDAPRFVPYHQHVALIPVAHITWAIRHRTDGLLERWARRALMIAMVVAIIAAVLGDVSGIGLIAVFALLVLGGGTLATIRVLAAVEQIRAAVRDEDQ